MAIFNSFLYVYQRVMAISPVNTYDPTSVIHCLWPTPRGFAGLVRHRFLPRTWSGPPGFDTLLETHRATGRWIPSMSSP